MKALSGHFIVKMQISNVALLEVISIASAFHNSHLQGFQGHKKRACVVTMRLFPHTSRLLQPAGQNTKSAQFWSDKTSVHDNTSAKLFSHTPGLPNG